MSGDQVRISAEGPFTIHPDYPAINADGANELGTPLEYDVREGTNDAGTYPMPDGMMGAMVGKLGPGGRVFLIGADVLSTAENSGELHVVINDNITNNNSGILDISVEGTGLFSP